MPRRAAAPARSPGTAPRICPDCSGRGVVAESQGLFALSQPCPRCRGNGTVIDDPCAHCRGSGRERRTKRYSVKIPAGVRDGTRIRLKGKGEPGANGGPPGDLFVVSRVERLRCTSVAATTCRGRPGPTRRPCSAATVDVPTPEGPISLKVPAGATGRQASAHARPRCARLKGSGKGDVIARVRVTVPTKLTKAEREAVEQLQKVSRENPREEVFS